MSPSLSFRKDDTLADAAEATINFLREKANVSIIVSDSTKLGSAQVTTSPSAAIIADSALWTDIEFTNNGCRLPGPITGIYLAASGADVQYSVVAMDVN